MAGDGDGFEPLQEDSRLTKLEDRLGKAENREVERTGRGKAPKTDQSYNVGNRVLASLIGSIGGGLIIGWGIDRLFNTSPWGLLGFLFIGIGWAFWNIISLANRR